jgi:HSP20 family protein
LTLFDVVTDIWDPFVGNRSLKQMLNTVDRLFDPFLGSAAPAAVAVDFRTPWDVKEDDDAFRLRLDMPGLSKDEVSAEDAPSCLRSS